MRILHVVGARPNFMKVAPVLREAEKRGLGRHVLVHSGQHYDEALSEALFRDLDLPRPDINLGVGSASHAVQTARVLEALESVILSEAPDLVFVVGDVNSTLAAALCAVKLGVPVAHLEAGLRSGDLGMPEEVNRILTDHVSELLLTPSEDASANVMREGIDPGRVRFVGNVMIDSLDHALGRARALAVCEPLGIEPGCFALVTLHRPANVDDPIALGQIVEALVAISSSVPVVFPAHPRTRRRLSEFDLRTPGVRLLEPVPYLTMLGLLDAARVVLTDSGGVQEETTVLGIPCLTLRETTERPITLTQGTNRLVPERDSSSIVEAFRGAWSTPRRAQRPVGWDGGAAVRVCDELEHWAAGRSLLPVEVGG